MTAVRIVPATRELAEQLAPHVRPEEIAEVLAADGQTPQAALVQGVERSDPVFAAFFGDELAAIWGVVPMGRSVLGGRAGSIWMLTSAAVERRPNLFWRGCKAELPKVFDRYDRLVNAIDARHVRALRWAKRLGFQLAPPAPYGKAGLPFSWFRVRKGNLHV